MLGLLPETRNELVGCFAGIWRHLPETMAFEWHILVHLEMCIEHGHRPVETILDRRIWLRQRFKDVLYGWACKVEQKAMLLTRVGDGLAINVKIEGALPFPPALAQLMGGPVDVEWIDRSVLDVGHPTTRKYDTRET